MTAFLLDTMVVSEVWKVSADRNLLRWFRLQQVEDLFISSISLAELKYGAIYAPTSHKTADLSRWLSHSVRPLFKERVLEVTESVILRWITLEKQGRKRNRTFSQPDLFLAATALEHDLTLVTRNLKDFADIPNLQLLNPWEPAT